MKSLGTSTPVGGGNPLIDVTQVPLENLATIKSAALSKALAWAGEQAQRPTPESLFAFSSAL